MAPLVTLRARLDHASRALPSALWAAPPLCDMNLANAPVLLLSCRHGIRPRGNDIKEVHGGAARARGMKHANAATAAAAAAAPAAAAAATATATVTAAPELSLTTVALRSGPADHIGALARLQRRYRIVPKANESRPSVAAPGCRPPHCLQQPNLTSHARLELAWWRDFRL